LDSLTAEPAEPPATIDPMAEAAQQPLERELEEIGARLAWVRDYL
jgi:hypothetical protein